MQVVHGRSERKLILLNELNQPIGPTKEVVSELGSFLGTLARNKTFCPLNIFNWKMLKTHDDMWNYIKEKYDIPEVGKVWALGAIKLAWRGYKCRLKKMHFYAYADDATRMAKRPKFVSESAFKEILEYWNSDEAKEKKKETPDALSSKDLFVATRKRKPGKGDSGPSSQTVDDKKIQKKIEEMEERMQQRMQEKFNAQKDTMERDVTVNIIAQLQRLNPGLTLDPNMLRFTVGSPGDMAALQLINRPFVGCNNQGIENEERREDHSNEDDLDLTREDF
ncbi:hypothetical protein KY290_015910 [Solanum tuberosum]|uniref:Uncharacterized protein n=1 Tax=Solanum tuberosum TaxID=4113 RepID=A0ABQ7VVY7_SOLTU|nr:hypothetical protein KY289_014138 [Solanum tuberosum]KAH0771929.1 hypothetical protein KY290_015910 [Solanum tuberosum]